MFPTPPSLEHNPVASPCGATETQTAEYTDFSIIRVKQEIYPNMGSPQEENIGKYLSPMKLKLMYLILCLLIVRLLFRRLELRFQTACYL